MVVWWWFSLIKKIKHHLQQIQVIVEANMIHLGETSKLELTLTSKHSPLCIYNLPPCDKAKKNKKNWRKTPHPGPISLTAGTWKMMGNPWVYVYVKPCFRWCIVFATAPKRWGSATSTPTWSRATLRYEGWNSSAFSLAREKTHTRGFWYVVDDMGRSTWRIIPTSKMANSHGDCNSPQDRVVGPLPNGHENGL